MATIGNAQIVITATSNVKPGANAAGREAAATLSNAFSPVTSRLSSIAGKAMSAVKNTLKIGAAAAGGIMAAGLGAALTKGFSRLQAIDNAQAKMRGLGYAGQELQGIMDSALKSVEGTAFGLGDAANAAANALNAGVAPGEQLDRTLKAVVGSAAASGASMVDLQSVFNKAATAGSANNEVLGMLQERGIPIIKQLAEDLGVSQVEVTELARKGGVSFDQLIDSASAASGTIAEEMGTTLSGRLANAWAAIGRVGAGLLGGKDGKGGLFGQLSPMLADITGQINKLKPVAEQVGERVGRAFTKILKGARGLFDLFVNGNFSKAFREAFNVEEDSPLVGFLLTVRELGISAFKELTGGITAFAAAWKHNDGEVTSSGFPGLMERLGYIARQVFDYVRDVAIPALMRFAEEFRTGEGAGGQFRDAISRVWEILGNLIDFVVAQVLPRVGDLLKLLWENKDALILLAAMIVGAVAAFKTMMFIKNVITIVKALWTILSLNPIGIIITLIGALVAGLVYLYNTNDTARAIIDKAWAGIKKVIDLVITWFVKVGWPWIKKAFEQLAATVMWLWDNIFKPYFQFIWDLMKKVGTWVKDTLWPWMRDAFTNIATKAGDLKDKAVRAFELIKSGVSTAWEGAKTILNRFKDGLDSLKEKFGKVKDGIASIWGTITGAIAGPINKVIDTINSFTQNLAEKLSKIPGVSISIPKIPNVSVPSQGGYSGGYQPGRYADGGLVRGPWKGPKADNVLGVDRRGVPVARVNPREMVLSVAGTRKLMRKIGMGGLNMLNRGELPGFAGGGMIGGSLGDTLQEAGSWAWKLLTNPVKALKDLADSMLGGIGSSWAGMIGKGVIGDSMSKFASWVKDNLFGGDDGSAPGGAPGSWRGIWNIVKALWPDAIKTSDVRDSTIAGTNIKSLHASGRALDFVLNPWSRMVGATKTLSQMRRWTELIHTPAGMWQQNRGALNPKFPEITRRMHYNHVHAALAKGGLVPFTADAGVMLDKGLNLLNNRTGGPEPLVRADQEMKLDAETIRALRGDVKVMIDVDDLRGLRTLEDFLEMIDVRTRQIRGV